MEQRFGSPEKPETQWKWTSSGVVLPNTGRGFNGADQICICSALFGYRQRLVVTATFSVKALYISALSNVCAAYQLKTHAVCVVYLTRHTNLRNDLMALMPVAHLC